MRNYPLSLTSLILIALVLAGLTFEISRNAFPLKIDVIPTVLSFRDNCKTISGKNNDALVLAVQIENMAKELMTSLCKNPTVSKQFGEVRAHWMPNEREMLDFVGKGLVDLVLIKDNFIHAFNSDEVYGYEEVASYNKYAAFFIGLREKPILNKEYLLGKRIGILDYASSRSGHIAPMTLFKELDLDENQVQLVYGKSHQQLRWFLENGSVDIISTYWSDADAERFNSEYRTALVSEIEGSKWYLKEADKNTALKCAIQQELSNLALQDQGYYRQLTVTRPCAQQGTN
ncbi:hypothetical protein [Planctobacterium marinum]|uniref:hypothetical protein n=1 Tax=Planctobacterium marinum TaxID=1631968 RepID=UPI001E46179A|nr:hypothetical protein [Planctobacterium marinum]MCC2605055.1 hypothetical protein [Planctobacterium marinum]